MGQNPGDQPASGGQSAQSGQPTQQQSGGQQNQQARQQSQQGQQPPESEQDDVGEQVASWFTETLVRTAVAVFGVALVLLALGQIAGIELLQIVGDFLTSSIGAWLLIAFFGLLLVVAASKSWNISSR